MASKARKAFDENAQDVDRLLQIHTTLGGSGTGPPALPDNVGLMVTAVYDFLRTQRNDLGQPATDRLTSTVKTLSLTFRWYYQIAEELRRLL